MPALTILTKFPNIPMISQKTIFPKWLLPALTLLLLASPKVYGQYHANLNQSNAQEAIWVDSVFNSMTADERIGQLFMIRAHSNLGPEHVQHVERLVKEYHVGGMCFFQGTPAGHLRLINRYQALSKLPLMMAIDGEWGLGMRMKKTTVSYPKQLMLGAIRDNHLIYDMGREIARQMKRIGLHVNFAPVVDVNNNINNPVIGTRSFGEDKINVAIKGINYMKGMQDNGILACAKHFPGHGDTATDSHKELPLILHGRKRLDSIELYPFRALIDKGIGSIMIAHLEVPALEKRDNRPTTLSLSTVTNLLQDTLGFHGLIFTDGLEMEGVAKYFSAGEVEVEALRAGNDIMLLPKSLKEARSKIKEAIEKGIFTQQSIDHKVKRILRSKYRLGFNHFTSPSLDNLDKDLNSPAAHAMKEILVENALTLVRDEHQQIPIGKLDSLQLASLAIGSKRITSFQQRLLDYAPVMLLQSELNISGTVKKDLIARLAKKDLVLVSLHNMGRSAKSNFGITASVLSFLEELNQQTEVVLIVFGNPYCLSKFDNLPSILQAYNEDPVTQDIAAQAIFGAISINGRLPITASKKSPFNAGISRGKSLRMGYSIPERVGMDSDTLKHKIDAIVKRAINSRATPGCVVLVARHGKVVFQKAYGHHSYKRSQSVRVGDVYDLASVTKIAATTISLMDLVQKGYLDLDKSLGYYIPELKGTNKDTIGLRSVLAHHAALKPWIPFYTNTLNDDGSRKKDIYQSQQSSKYSVAVANKLYMNQAYLDSIWYRIDTSHLRSNHNYRYSDLGFYYLAKIVNNLSGRRLDFYAKEQFYRPLGLYNINFNPHDYFSLNRIPPTEEDTYWRGQKVQAYVHDMGAAMLGGVGGHAGLFANAHDLAVIGQMLLQRGVYGNQVFLKPDVLQEFTNRYNKTTRRALGFDMKQLNTSRKLNMSALASEETFGHLGFTGTCMWLDPAEDLLFIFLSNRTYPSMRNNKLNRMDIRPQIQSAAYEAIYRPKRMVAVPLGAIAGKLPQAVNSIH